MRYAAFYGDFECKECDEVAELRQRSRRRAKSLRRCRRRLKVQREKLNEARELLDQKDRTLAGICHDLRTPLQAILGWAQVARAASPDASELDEALRGIENSARAQAALIQDILDLARSASGELKVDPAPVDLNDLAAAAMAVVQPVAAAKGVDLVCTPADSPAHVLGDPRRLQQVIWNLLTNAVKFTPAGGRVYVNIEIDGSEVQLRVRDTGDGIRAEFIPRIFAPFAQDRPPEGRAPGVGLGLAIVQELLKLHGGQIEAASPGEGRGATFTARLPMIESENAALAQGSGSF
jgi:signal transduction histidine kinase